MTTTAWATADGQFEDGDGRRRPARAELSRDGLAIFAPEGQAIVSWRSKDLIRTMGPDGFMIGARFQAGMFVFDPDEGTDLIRVLASVPDADAPVMPRTLVWTMVTIVALALSSLFALGWGFFWLIGWLAAPGAGTGTPG